MIIVKKHSSPEHLWRYLSIIRRMTPRHTTSCLLFVVLCSLAAFVAQYRLYPLVRYLCVTLSLVTCHTVPRPWQLDRSIIWRRDVFIISWSCLKLKNTTWECITIALFNALMFMSCMHVCTTRTFCTCRFWMICTHMPMPMMFEAEGMATRI